MFSSRLANLKTLGFLLALLWLLTPSLALAQLALASLESIGGSSLSIQYASAIFNRTTNQTTYTVTLKNTASQGINGPIYLVISGITPSTVAFANASGVSVEGSPYIMVTANTLAAGQAVTAKVAFSNPSRARFNFTGTAYHANLVLPKHPTIVSINRVSQTTIDAQTVEETYTADVQNDRHDRTNVEAIIISSPQNVEIIKCNLSFGNVAAAGTEVSQDTFTLRHPPQMTIASTDLQWNVFSDPVPPDIFPQVGGISMPGNPTQLAIDAILDYRDAGSPKESDISIDANQGPVLRTVIDVEINLNATVADVNNLLSTVNGKIVGMTESSNWISVLIPDPGSLDALNAIIANLKQSTAVVDALPRYLPVPQELPTSSRLTPDSTNPNFMTQPEIANHLAVKGAAAWNARAALDYPTSCVPFLIVADKFGKGLSPTTHSQVGLDNGFDNSVFDILNPQKVDRSKPDGHGYHVAGILAGQFTDTPGPHTLRQFVAGMFPGSDTGSLRIPAVFLDRNKVGYAGDNQEVSEAIKDINNGVYSFSSPAYKLKCTNGASVMTRRVIVNYSKGLTHPNAAISQLHAQQWASLIRGTHPKDANYEGEGTHPKDANYEGEFALFASAGNGYGLLAWDAGGMHRMGLLVDVPDPINPGHFLPRFTNTAVVENRPAINSGNVYAPRQWLHLSSNVEGNISAIGALGDTFPIPPLPVAGTEVAWGVNPPILQSTSCAVGNQAGIFSFTGPQLITDVGCKTGTSMATPQVAGLAAYLWALRPDLDPTQLINHIRYNAETTLRDDSSVSLPGAPVIDAYATILSADRVLLPLPQYAPARLAIFDVASSAYPMGYPNGGSVNRDRVFDLTDAKLILTKLFPLDPPDPDHLLDPGDGKKIAPPPTSPDYSRYDLNGDGFTGGDRKARFNLDVDYDANGGAVYCDNGKTAAGADCTSPSYNYAGDAARKVTLNESKVSDFQILCYYVHSSLFKAEDLPAFNDYVNALVQSKGISSCEPPKLNDTGITWCANQNTNFLSCPVAGFPGQDAGYGRDVTNNDDSDGHAGFSFTKIGADGSPLPLSAESWSCIKDNVTGLIWEVKTSDGGLRDWNRTYTNFSPDYPQCIGLQYPDYCPKYSLSGHYGNADDATGFVNAVNALGLCGASDWRLPTAEELQSIVDYGVINPVANPRAIDTRFFPNTGFAYWSSSPYAGSPYGASLIGFQDGRYGVSGWGGVSGWYRHHKDNGAGIGFAVRLVRAQALALTAGLAQAASVPERFTVSPDGLEVTDKRTGLIWRRYIEKNPFDYRSYKIFTWQQALQQAANEAARTGVAWRLPNIKELASLVDQTIAYPGPTINTAAFPDTPDRFDWSSSRFFWSSSPYAGNVYTYPGNDVVRAWGVYFNLGKVDIEWVIASIGRVRLVRAGQ
jgi:hypothetical protein